jgi:hypothetical protein
MCCTTDVAVAGLLASVTFVAWRARACWGAAMDGWRAWLAVVCRDLPLYCDQLVFRYAGSGYAVDLPVDDNANARSSMLKLKNDGWCAEHTESTSVV